MQGTKFREMFVLFSSLTELNNFNTEQHLVMAGKQQATRLPRFLNT